MPDWLVLNVRNVRDNPITAVARLRQVLTLDPQVFRWLVERPEREQHRFMTLLELEGAAPSLA